MDPVPSQMPDYRILLYLNLGRKAGVFRALLSHPVSLRETCQNEIRLFRRTTSYLSVRHISWAMVWLYISLQTTFAASLVDQNRSQTLNSHCRKNGTLDGVKLNTTYVLSGD